MRFLFFAPLLVLGACSHTNNVAPVDWQHPASTEAAEATTRPLRPSLRGDAATERTHELIAQRERDAEAAANDATSSGAQIAQPQPMKGGHEHHNH
jgi:hypothetical protein